MLAKGEEVEDNEWAIGAASTTRATGSIPTWGGGGREGVRGGGGGGEEGAGGGRVRSLRESSYCPAVTSIADRRDDRVCRGGNAWESPASLNGLERLNFLRYQRGGGRACAQWSSCLIHAVSTHGSLD